jgi:prepilin-type N-terminal cleavage/methylation domain-containing protein
MKGFTLAEFVVTLLVISIIAVVISIRQPATAAFSVDTASDALLKDIRFTQVLSMSFNANYQIQFNATNYQILTPTGGAYQHPDGQVATINLPQGVSLSSPQSKIIFDDLGTPLDASSTPLAASITLTLSSGSDTRQISITPQTGFANET